MSGNQNLDWLMDLAGRLVVIYFSVSVICVCFLVGYKLATLPAELALRAWRNRERIGEIIFGERGKIE